MSGCVCAPTISLSTVTVAVSVRHQPSSLAQGRSQAQTTTPAVYHHSLGTWPAASIRFSFCERLSRPRKCICWRAWIVCNEAAEQRSSEAMWAEGVAVAAAAAVTATFTAAVTAVTAESMCQQGRHVEITLRGRLGSSSEARVCRGGC